MQFSNNFNMNLVDHVNVDSEVRGDFGILFWGLGSGSGTPTMPGGTQAEGFDVNVVNLPACYQCTLWEEDGNVATIRAHHVALQSAPYDLLATNDIGALQAPTYSYFYDLGCNVAWYYCVDLKAGVGFQFYTPYLQAFNTSQGGAPFDMRIEPGVLWTLLQGGVLVNGGDVLDDYGVQTQISGVNVFGAGPCTQMNAPPGLQTVLPPQPGMTPTSTWCYLQPGANINCQPGATGETVAGGSDYVNLQSTTPNNQSGNSAQYGVYLSAGCQGAHVAAAPSQWMGMAGNIYDAAGPQAGTLVAGLQQGNPATVAITASGSATLSATSGTSCRVGGAASSGACAAVYDGLGGYVQVVEGSATVIGPTTYTLDTPSNIVTAVSALTGLTAAEVVGQTLRLRLENNTSQVLTVAGSAGDTIQGNCKAPMSGTAVGANQWSGVNVNIVITSTSATPPTTVAQVYCN